MSNVERFHKYLSDIILENDTNPYPDTYKLLESATSKYLNEEISKEAMIETLKGHIRAVNNGLVNGGKKTRKGRKGKKGKKGRKTRKGRKTKKGRKGRKGRKTRK